MQADFMNPASDDENVEHYSVFSYKNSTPKKITHTNAVVTLLRKSTKVTDADNPNHAFLIIESVENNTPVTCEAHLLIKPGTNHNLAKIVFEPTTTDRKMALSEYCFGCVWDISPKQKELLLKLITFDQARADEGLINYVMLGKTPIAGSVGKSSVGSGSTISYKSSTDSVEVLRGRANKQIKKINKAEARNGFLVMCGNSSVISAESLDFLLRDGHNCLSWACAMLEAIGKKNVYESAIWHNLIINPRAEMTKMRDGDELTPRIGK